MGPVVCVWGPDTACFWRECSLPIVEANLPAWDVLPCWPLLLRRRPWKRSVSSALTKCSRGDGETSFGVSFGRERGSSDTSLSLLALVDLDGYESDLGGQPDHYPHRRSQGRHFKLGRRWTTQDFSEKRNPVQVDGALVILEYVVPDLVHSWIDASGVC
ncbi:hypothetical protein Nepgr_028532 [Nepenthes gracilis]|uniref:Uncharacterized protein n=1 Tax=Nepenthes gracilis TaxID=150966 RepID=A0AAD3TD29_NEPGR|nr:hypothetical protein Nepgr_028532 [Nepenthes gracilis]